MSSKGSVLNRSSFEDFGGDTAVPSLPRSLERLTSIAVLCFYFNKALPEMSRLETKVLGHATEGAGMIAEDSAHPQVLVASLAI